MLLKAFVANLKSSSPTIRRTAASSAVSVCQHSRRAHYFYTWLLNVLLGKVLTHTLKHIHWKNMVKTVCLRYLNSSSCFLSIRFGRCRWMRNIPVTWFWVYYWHCATWCLFFSSRLLTPVWRAALGSFVKRQTSPLHLSSSFRYQSWKSTLYCCDLTYWYDGKQDFIYWNSYTTSSKAEFSVVLLCFCDSLCVCAHVNSILCFLGLWTDPALHAALGS